VRGSRSTKSKLIEGEGPLSRVPPAAVFLVVAIVFTVGVVVGGLLGALLLGVLAAGVAVLLAVTWGTLAPSQRFGRVLVLAVLVAVALSVLLVK
jgi:hypothetical protein